MKKAILFIESTLIGLSIIAFGVYFYVALSRVAYPFAIEWIESNVFLSIVRVLQGKPLFVPPSYEFIQTIYPPFYYYLVAGFARITNQVMFSMRAVSILASLQIFIMIYVLCRLRRITPRLSIVAVGLFAASYAATGYWFDVGRVDTLFLALLLTAYVLAMVQTKRDNILGAIAALFLFLSFATKQSALLAAPFLVLYLLLERRWMKALWFGLSLGLSCGLFVMIMNVVSEGWFWIYVYEIPSAHPISWQIITHDIWTSHILPQFPWLIVVIGLAAIVLLHSRDRAGTLDYGALVVTFFVPLSAMSISSLAKQWGYLNGLLPMVAALAVTGVEAYQRIVIAVATWQGSTWLWRGLYFVTSATMILQFLALHYDFRAQIPTRASLDAGYEILDLIRNAEGPIFIPAAPYLLYMAGRPTHFHVSSLGDLNLAVQHDPGIEAISREHRDRISEYLLSKSVKTAIFSQASWFRKAFGPENGYECTSLVADQPPLSTLTGATTYLDQICRFGGGSTIPKASVTLVQQAHTP